MSKRILLISSQPEDGTFLAEVAQVVGAKLDVEPEPISAVEYIVTHKPLAVFIDVGNLRLLEAFEIESQKRFGLFSELALPYRFHFVSNRPLHQNREVIRSPFFGSYFERPTEHVENCAKFYGRAVLTANPESPRELKYFLDERANSQTLTLVRSDQKQEAAEAVRQYLIQARIPARIANTITNAVDELLMNAIFDAPSDIQGQPLYSSTARNQVRELSEREQVKMSIGFDGFYLAVSVTDFFGSIDRARLLNHVSMNYREQEYTARRGQAGAGLGLSAIFSSGGSLIYHCDAGKKTEVTLLYRTFNNFRDFKTQFSFFSARFYHE